MSPLPQTVYINLEKIKIKIVFLKDIKRLGVGNVAIPQMFAETLKKIAQRLKTINFDK